MFLSYASQDAEAAVRICAALRAAGIEVWFDQSALRGGDIWDQTIRKQIKACVLFIPVISNHTRERDEGYFRLEWKLAVDRSHLMTGNKTFLLPVAIDDTREDDENVPERFKDIHWTRLPAGETPAAFVDRVRGLVSLEPPHVTAATASPAGPVSTAAAPTRQQVPTSSRSHRVLLAIAAAAVLGALAYFALDRFWISKHPAPPATPAAAPAAFSPPPHSIAVLPFVNMSGDASQEYFSDGLTEELLNSLAEINELQVAARTSAFSFKGKDTDIGTIARKLNVGTVLEGSVRRSGNTVRVTTQLINAITGFHLWSHTYDRDLGDVLKLETEIAGTVASALKVNLLGDVATKIELGGTRNPAAFDAYLRGEKARYAAVEAKDDQTAIAAYTQAIRLDSNYALAFASRSRAYSGYAQEYATGAAIHENFDKAHADAREAIRLAPELAEGHLALAEFFERASLDFTQAGAAYERALALASGNATVVRASSAFLAEMGRFDEGISGLRRAVALDPLDRRSHHSLGFALSLARHYEEALAAYTDSISLDPAFKPTYAVRGITYYLLGDLQNARTSCESTTYWVSEWCLAIVYDKLGRHADAEAELAQLKASGDAVAYQYAAIYAQWGNRAKALEWLETAMRLRDPGLVFLKTSALMDPLRKEPRFQAIMRALKFPD